MNEIQIHIHKFNFTNEQNRNQPRLYKVDRKDMYIVNDDMDESFTIYQD